MRRPEWTYLLTHKWLWIIIFGCIAAAVGPWTLIYLFVALPPPFNACVCLSIVFGWGIVTGWKDWILYKRKEEQVKHIGSSDRPKTYPT